MNAKKPNKTTLYLIAILWPSFLTAAAATVVFFALFDPVEFGRCEAEDNDCRMSSYSLGFLGFWLLTGLTSITTCYFNKTYKK